MAKASTLRLSNGVIAIIAGILAIGILLDGKLYNQAPKPGTIFNLTTPSTISISSHEETLMVFHRQAERWLLTEPAIAPLNLQRVKVLLDSNHQTARSYAASDLPLTELFADPVILNIDGNQFKIGTIEPVSKQRYVLADDRVYLQADHVMPMIRSGTSPFLDLAVTTSVSSVRIDGQELADITDWSSLKALGIVPRKHITTQPHQSIDVTQTNDQRKVFQLFLQEGVMILATPDSEFGYLISDGQAESLGLSKTKREPVQ